MEELRSTEILDKEIEADARKKAEKIVASAEEEAKKILDGVSGRIDEASKQKKEFYDSKFSRFEKNIEASIPLERERFLASFYADSVSKAFNDYLKNLGAEKRLSLAARKLSSLPENIADKKIDAHVFGFKAGDVSALLKKSLKNLDKIDEVPFEKSGEQPCYGNDFHEGIILEDEDKTFRVRLTVDEFVREIKDKYSNELATALFGGRLPE